MSANVAKRVLVVEDDADIAELLKIHLNDLACEVDVEDDGWAALRRTESGRYDLMILDLTLPGADGIQVCRQIRSRPGYMPILMLTARRSELERVAGLESGADDYLTKPFSILELLARVKALFRRAGAMQQQFKPTNQETLSIGDLTIDVVKHRVSVGDRDIDLTSKEFDLLLFFAQSPGRVFSRAELLLAVWDYRHTGYEHTVNSHINRLRTKIERDSAQPEYILTVWGVGYKFRDGGERAD